MNTDTYESLSFSLIFDNGMSLGFLWMPDNEQDIIEYATKDQPSLFTVGDFTQIARSLINAKRKEALERLRGWFIKKHSYYNWSDEKFNGMNRLVQSRVRSILS